MTTLLPQQILGQMCSGHYLSRAIYVAAKLGLADLLADGPRAAGDLAQATGTHAPSLERLLRFLAAAGVFAEPETGRFALTPIGEWLRSGIPGSRRAMAMLFAGPMQYRTWSELEYSLRTGEIAFDKAFGMSAFQYISQNPEEAAIFNEAMSSGSAQAAEAILAAYDFSSFGTLVDVGGGHGGFLTAVLQANPGVRGVIFDMPHAAEGGRKQVEKAKLDGRCQVVSGDFFEAVPPGADGYMLKSVIHDWDDERSIKILSNCGKVMAPQARLLVLEPVIPERIEASPWNQIIAGSDINMLVNVGGRERTDGAFRALFEAAGFELTRIVPSQFFYSVLEGVRR